jgi:peptide subunit release factor 1 (eRF1)
MSKQYLVSLAPDQEANDVEEIKSQLADLDIELVSDLGVNVLVVQIPGNDALQKIRNIKGVAAVEEDKDMDAL